MMAIQLQGCKWCFNPKTIRAKVESSTWFPGGFSGFQAWGSSISMTLRGKLVQDWGDDQCLDHGPVSK